MSSNPFAGYLVGKLCSKVAKSIKFTYNWRIMKICIINNLYPPYVRGGAEQVVAKTVQGLLERGHRVVIITSSPAGGSSSADQQCLPDARLSLPELKEPRSDPECGR